MAIFSRKQTGKKPDEQAKVSPEAAVEAKPTDDSPAKESSANESSARDRSTVETGAQAPAPSPAVAAEPAAAGDAVVAAPITPETTHEVLEPEAIVTPPVVPVEHRFGIDDAILLMRSLPTDPNMSLVVRVVRVTLGAVHVSIDEIIADALRKEARIKENIAGLESQIADIERQLGSLRRDIATQQADLKETANVRERLHMADQYSGHKTLPPPITNAMPRSTPSKPFTS
jgi:hypothetical protein